MKEIIIIFSFLFFILTFTVGLFSDDTAKNFVMWVMALLIAVLIAFSAFNGVTVNLNDQSWHFKIKFDPMPINITLPIRYDHINQMCLK